MRTITAGSAYSIENLTAGVYTLQVSKTGYKTAEYSIIIAADTVQDVILTPIDASVLLGDVNLDGQINSVDSNLLKRIVANTYKVEAGSVAEQAADLDSNGTINAVDSNLLKRKLLS